MSRIAGMVLYWGGHACLGAIMSSPVSSETVRPCKLLAANIARVWPRAGI
jgi:hypothetical protein